MDYADIQPIIQGALVAIIFLLGKLAW